MFCVVVVYYMVQAPSCLLCETWSIDCDCVWSCIPGSVLPRTRPAFCALALGLWIPASDWSGFEKKYFRKGFKR